MYNETVGAPMTIGRMTKEIAEALAEQLRREEPRWLYSVEPRKSGGYRVMRYNREK